MKIHEDELPAVGKDHVTKGNVMASVIECPGRWEDSIFEAVQIDIEGLDTPFVMTMALPKVCYRALSPFVRPADLYKAIAKAINKASLYMEIEDNA